MVLIIIILDVMFMAKRRHSCVSSAVIPFPTNADLQSTFSGKMGRQFLEVQDFIFVDATLFNSDKIDDLYRF